MPIAPGEVEAVFRESGAFRDGHFLLASGKHSPRYLEKFQVLQWPKRTEALCAAIAEAARAWRPETVAGPTTGGIILAHEVARQMGLRAVYAERDGDEPGRALRRGFTLRPDERVLVVDDILSTGGSVEETLAAVGAAGGHVVGVAVLVDRSGGAATVRGAPLVSLWQLAIPAYDAAECPQCREGLPWTKPGTTDAPAAEKGVRR